MVQGTHTKEWEWFDRRRKKNTGGPRTMDGPSNLLMGMSWIEETRTHYGGRHILATQQMSYYIHLYRRLTPDRGGKPRQTGRMTKENTGPTSRPEENIWINYALFPVEFLVKQDHQQQGIRQMWSLQSVVGITRKIHHTERSSNPNFRSHPTYLWNSLRTSHDDTSPMLVSHTRRTLTFSIL
jgi:hypothetical protein